MGQLSLMEEGQILVNEDEKVAFNINQDDIFICVTAFVSFAY